MSAPTMDVFLLATPQAGIERAALVQNLAAAFKKDASYIEKMLAQPRNLVKTDVTPEIAAKYKMLIEKSGGQCELVAREQTLVDAQPEPSSILPAAPGQAAGPAVPQSPPATAPLPAADGAIAAKVAEPVQEPKLEPALASAVVAVEPTAEVAQDIAQQTEKEIETATETEQTSGGQAACYCAKCGSVVYAGQNKCQKCFTPVTEYVHRNKVTAGLLAFFLGGFGLHRLYLGQWWGIFYLLFFSTLIPSLVAIIEAVVFFVTPKKKWQAHYGLVQKTSEVMGALYVLAFIVSIGVAWALLHFSLPLYQDYSKRAQIQKTMPLVLDARAKVEDYFKKNGTYPTQNAEVGIESQVSDSAIEIISVQNEGILLVVYHLPDAKEKHTILWTPAEQNGKVSWDCSEGSMPQKYRPPECRVSTGRKKPNQGANNKTGEPRLAKQLYSENRHLSLKVPMNWSMQQLLPGASIGVANLGDENYVVVLEDAKIDFEENLTLADYSRNIQLQLAENIKDGMVQGEAYPVTVAGLPGEQFIFPGVVNGIRISYMITLLEGDTHFYRVLSWTLESRMEKNKDLLKKISESLELH